VALLDCGQYSVSRVDGQDVKCHAGEVVCWGWIGEYSFVNLDTMLQFWLQFSFIVQEVCRSGGGQDVFQCLAAAEGAERFGSEL